MSQSGVSHIQFLSNHLHFSRGPRVQGFKARPNDMRASQPTELINNPTPPNAYPQHSIQKEDLFPPPTVHPTTQSGKILIRFQGIERFHLFFNHQTQDLVTGETTSSNSNSPKSSSKLPLSSSPISSYRKCNSVLIHFK